MTPNAMAELLNVPRYHAYAWMRDDKIPYLRTVVRILLILEKLRNGFDGIAIQKGAEKS